MTTNSKEETEQPENPSTRRDSLDFRDLIYRPALLPLADQLLPNKQLLQIDDQGQEGACTGFGLAAVINYLLRAKDNSSQKLVSPRMLYEMAKHHDQWPGEDYQGSSARGAMKGWSKNGVCLASEWKYTANDPGFLTRERQKSALEYPLGAYYRIQRRRSDIHAALNEVKVVFATAKTHSGWSQLTGGTIPFRVEDDGGGHAFAIVGYTKEGFVIQNSWGENWGGVTIEGETYPGCAIWEYADFDRNLWDAWVARLALPLESMDALAATTTRYAQRPGGPEVVDNKPPRPTIREHYVHIDDGRFDNTGDYFSEAGEVRQIIKEIMADNPTHILLYAHGGLNTVGSSAARVGMWRPVFKKNKIHEIHFIWETGLLEELGDVLRSKLNLTERRAAGPSDWWDSMLERVTQWAGSALWKEMQSDAESAFLPGKAGDQFVGWLIDSIQSSDGPRPQIHLAGHSAGAIWLGHLLKSWQRHPGVPISNLILFAPACTVDFFESHIKPAVTDSVVNELHHFLLDDETERDDNVAGIYRKSLLYLVSRSFQSKQSAVPLMGMEKHWEKIEPDLPDQVNTYITSKNSQDTSSTSHGGFDNDTKTMNSLLKLVLGNKPIDGFKRNDLGAD
ncbi:MAG: C1 family peptidase [Chloroflexi bacterium]|nr:C1 family peptidase [Chloroflexota bacterium]